MRTTLDIADDVLNAAKELARRENKTAGQVISELARRALTQIPSRVPEPETRGEFGIHPFPSRGGIVSNEIINEIRNEDAY